MLNIWKGYGWLVPAILIAAFIDVQFVIDYFMGDGFYGANNWVKIISLVVVCLFMGGVGLLLNYKARLFRRTENIDDIIKPPAHTLLFLPIEIWAVIVPCLVLGLHYLAPAQQDKTLSYLENPKINDIYAVDFSKIFKNEDPVYKYGTMLVVSTNLNLIEIQSSTHAYDGMSGVRKDIHNGKAKDMRYYGAEVTAFNVQELIRFYRQKAILSVKRD
ncbi:hypothetical protein [Marinomonas transparens]|uniref:Uncharacterized protein n=1 Tax=Marinomonas transparens TaxID=2795388 RepID=A0A934JTZ0_9GAMM|nr:hypothetical protein [Marinomonas transparens]MBJ7537320.1 hypothetical protein [Marinomonas transparens]